MISSEILAAFKRRRITAAMAEVCLERGFREATISRVCAKAKIARNTLYEQFDNKDAVFAALLERVSGEAFERIGSACAAAPDDPDAQVEAGLRAALEWVAAEPASAHALLSDAPAAAESGMRLHVEITGRLAELLRQKVPPDPTRPEAIEEMVVGGLLAIVQCAVLAGEADRVPTLLPSMLGFLWQPFLPDE
jgi:AcrR family transcriptional regulator